MGIYKITSDKPNEKIVRQMRLSLSQTTTRGRAQSLSRMTEVIKEFHNVKLEKVTVKESVREKKQVHNGLRSFLLQCTSGYFLCKVSESASMPACHCILVLPGDSFKVYDLSPKYGNIQDCKDIIFEMWKFVADK